MCSCVLRAVTQSPTLHTVTACRGQFHLSHSPHLPYFKLAEVMSASPPLVIAAAAKQNESVTHVIHHHVYETAEDNKDLLAIDLSGPAWGTVKRDQQGHVTHASGLNMLMGYSWKTYLRPREKLSPYYTLGTVSVVVPHFEVGVDWRKNMCVSCFYCGLHE